MQLLRRLHLYFHTVRWLQARQLLWLIYRRARPVVPAGPVRPEGVRSLRNLQQWAPGPEPVSREFCFLNVARPASVQAMDWHPQSVSRLWRYHLHYFDYLQWQVFSADEKAALIQSWIDSNPQGTPDSWEPYTASLRIVNWVKYFASNPENIPDHWQQSLLEQSYWLSLNLEKHICANHLLKNAKALVFAGAWFDGPVGKKLLVSGQQLFLEQVEEQFLTDGGHYERSPMYHSIAVEDCLDVINLFRAAFDKDKCSALDTVVDRATAGLKFLETIRGGDDQLPLFNDSAVGMAAEPEQLLDYGQRLSVFEPEHESGSLIWVEMRQSGIYGYRHNGDSLLIDCGEVGPAYQPGHTHCDMLSYELCIDGCPIVVDPGVHGYEGDDTRQYLRSTAAHNTVCVDGVEQSEIWGTFRVARRARPGTVHFSRASHECIEFQGSHDGYMRLPQAVLHRRMVVADLSGVWTFIDTLEGSGQCVAASFIHFAPSLLLEPADANTWNIVLDSRTVARVWVEGAADSRLEQSYVCPSFGIREPAMVLVLQAAGTLPLRLQYRIERNLL